MLKFRFPHARTLAAQPATSASAISGIVSGIAVCGIAMCGIALFGTGCADPTTGGHASALAVEGRYIPPAHVLEISDQFNVNYVGAGPWIDEETSCSGTFTEGASNLREYIYQYFPQAYLIGGYSCRPIVGNETQTSVHSIGRALDIMIYPLPGEEADNDLGDPLANWLIKNAEHIGIQFLIWDRTSWGSHRPVGNRERPYGGSPHADHLHIELSVEASALQTAFFQGEQTPPIIEECGALPEGGAIIDELDPCTQLMGRSEYWRRVPGVGHGEHVVWTNAFEGDSPSNWARYQVAPTLPGPYRVQAYTGTEFSRTDYLRYEVHHGQSVSEVTIDPSGGEGWRELGTFDFEVGGGQAVALFDNRSPEEVSAQGALGADPHIAVDAIRLAPLGVDPEDIPDKPDTPHDDPEGDDEEYGDLEGGCQSSSGRGNSLPLVLLALAFLRMRLREGA